MMLDKELMILFDGSDTKVVNFYVFNNSNGTIRWLIPTSSSFPTFLTFYNSSGTKAELLKYVVRLLYFFRIKQFVLKKK
ncbi:MAG: hypothetical protein GYA62_09640, partial [Bacteroidales bacterium]|nr:hypothetical protein [Bacteroidales bacterium]